MFTIQNPSRAIELYSFVNVAFILNSICMRLHFCMVQFDLLLTPGDLPFFLSWWSVTHPRARGRRNVSTPELVIDLIRFLGFIFFRRILISVQ